MSTYYDLLKRPEWQAKRLSAILAAGNHCQDCGKGLTTCGCDNCLATGETVTHFEVHHRYYARGRKPWEYPDEAFLCLCRSCHGHYTATMDVLKAIAGLLPKNQLEALVRSAKDIGRKWILDVTDRQGEDDVPLIDRLPLHDLPPEVGQSIVPPRS